MGPLIITHELSSSIKAKHIYLPRVQTILKEHQRYFSVLLSRMKKFLLNYFCFCFWSICLYECVDDDNEKRVDEAKEKPDLNILNRSRSRETVGDRDVES